MKDSYDCIVIGGGPAGSTTAALVAEAGFDTLLVEREKMPRFHVGESLMPETYHTFKRLGVLDRMKHGTFVQKRSVQFVSHTGKASRPFFFTQHDPRDCSQTWQVERAEFDQMLFENAQAKGAECRDQTRVMDVLFDGTRAVGVRVQNADKSGRQIAAGVVVDATGQQSLLATRLGIRTENPDLRKAAVWGYFRGPRREPGEAGGGTIILHTSSKRAWFWFIPLSGDIVSIGVVADNDYLLKGRSGPASVFDQELADCPAMGERLSGTELVGKMHVAKEFSYTTSRQAGDGWVLVGDAFSFIDPIYSSGVFFALKSGEMAADCIAAGLRDGDTSALRLGAWTEEFNGGTRWISKLIGAFYSDPFSFGKFLKSFPQHRANLTDLLIGRIFHPGAGAMFDDMDPWLARARQQADEERAENPAP